MVAPGLAKLWMTTFPDFCTRQLAWLVFRSRPVPA